MLKKGYLATNLTFASTSHTAEIVENYFKNLDPIFEIIKECEDGRDISSLLEGPICHTGFKRLN
jgi:glutamate-1-semialdehyde 2,1-aminomutase